MDTGKWRMVAYLMILCMATVMAVAVLTSPRPVTALQSDALSESRAPMALETLAAWRVDIDRNAPKESSLTARITLAGAERMETVLLTDGWHAWPAVLSIEGDMITATWHPPDGEEMDSGVGLYVLALGRR